jgi:hypothetical protein
MKIFRISQNNKMVWHGSGGSFSGAASSFLGEWFGTDNPEYAKQYGQPQSVEIKMSNPYLMPLDEFYYYDRARGKSIGAGQRESREKQEQLKQMGYDGIIVSHRDGTKEYILFNKNLAIPTNKQPQAYVPQSSQTQNVSTDPSEQRFIGTPVDQERNVEIPSPSQNNALDVW